MLKHVIDVERERREDFAHTQWAKNYLNQNGLLSAILMVKKKYRYERMTELLTVMGLEDHLERIEFNASGQVVFKWANEEERTLFLLKWS